MTATRSLQITLLGYWHAGGGRSSGSYLDAMCERDEQLPVLPGRQLKGLLRQAVRRAEAWGWYAGERLPAGPMTTFAELLFGSASQAGQRDETSPGMMQIDSARLPAPDRSCLAGAGDLADELFGELFNTAIDEHGSAKAQSLRGIEVAIPVPLRATLRLRINALASTHRQQQQFWFDATTPWAILERALPLVDHLGAHRSRGLGECVMTLGTEEA